MCHRSTFFVPLHIFCSHEEFLFPCTFFVLMKIFCSLAQFLFDLNYFLLMIPRQPATLTTTTKLLLGSLSIARGQKGRNCVYILHANIHRLLSFETPFHWIENAIPKIPNNNSVNDKKSYKNLLCYNWFSQRRGRNKLLQKICYMLWTRLNNGSTVLLNKKAKGCQKNQRGESHKFFLPCRLS